MHEWLRSQLQTSSSSLTQPDSAYGEEIQGMLRLPDEAPPEQLRIHSERLKQIEDRLESA